NIVAQQPNLERHYLEFRESLTWGVYEHVAIYHELYLWEYRKYFLDQLIGSEDGNGLHPTFDTFVRDLVNLQPVHAAFVCEDQHVSVRGRNHQVIHHVFGACTHSDAPLAAA